MANEEDERMEELLRSTAASRSIRRRSVLDRFAQTQNYIRDSFDKLTGLWNEVHLSDSQRQRRVATAFNHIHVLVDEMVESEEEMVAQLKKDIADGLVTINRLREELEMAPFLHDHMPNPSVALHLAVKKEVDSLNAKHTERRREEEEIVERIGILSARLGKSAAEIIPSRNQLISRVGLENLRIQMGQLDSEVNTRLEQAIKWQSDMLEWTKKMGIGCVPSDNDLTAILEADVRSDEFVLTDGILDSLREYHEQVGSMFQNWFEETEFRWISEFTQLKELWDKCHVPLSDRHFTEDFHPPIDGSFEKILAKLEEEVRHWGLVYSARKEVYSLVDSWKELWKQKMELDDKMLHPGYLQSRSRTTNVQKDTQMKNSLDKKLAKMQKAIEAEVEKYQVSHEDAVLVEGVSPVLYIENEVTSYNLDLERQRMNRIAQRNAKNMSPAKRTPVKAKVPRTPASLGSMEPLHKRVHLEQSLSTPQSTNRLNRLPSMIGPTRTIDGCPKTSSPKHGRVREMASPAMREFATPLQPRK